MDAQFESLLCYYLIGRKHAENMYLTTAATQTLSDSQNKFYFTLLRETPPQFASHLFSEVLLIFLIFLSHMEIEYMYIILNECF